MTPMAPYMSCCGGSDGLASRHSSRRIEFMPFMKKSSCTLLKCGVSDRQIRSSSSTPTVGRSVPMESPASEAAA